MSVVDTRLFRLPSGATRRDRLRCGIGVTSIINKL